MYRASPKLKWPQPWGLVDSIAVYSVMFLSNQMIRYILNFILQENWVTENGEKIQLKRDCNCTLYTCIINFLDHAKPDKITIIIWTICHCKWYGDFYISGYCLFWAGTMCTWHSQSVDHTSNVECYRTIQIRSHVSTSSSIGEMLYLTLYKFTSLSSLPLVYHLYLRV